MTHRGFLFCMLASTLLIPQLKAELTSPSNDPVIIIPTSRNLLDRPFLGFGAEWDTSGYIGAGINEEDFELIKKRVEWMKLPLVRTMMQARWCYKGGDQYDWNSPQMQVLYRHLEFCEKNGTSVMLSEWGCEPGWLATPDIKKVNDPKYAEVIGKYLDHLILTKKLGALEYFGFVNEPNFEVKEYPRWVEGLKNIDAVLKERKIRDRIKLTGPGTAFIYPNQLDEWSWLKPTMLEAKDVLDAYDIHNYAPMPEARMGGIESIFKKAWGQVREGDPDHNKPMIISEAGYWIDDPNPHKKTDAGNNPLNRHWRYGIDMAQFAIQGINAGSSSVLAWMLDDSSHGDFNWGMWGSKAERFTLKPWFYPWALLSRYFPKNSEFVAIEPVKGIQPMAARLPGNSNEWSFCFVNPEKQAQSVRLKVPNGGKMDSVRYVYGEKHPKVDADGMPLPVEQKVIDLQDTLFVCEPESVTVISAARLAPAAPKK